MSSFACITGVMLTAFPVSILVEHFTKTYKTEGKRMFVIPRFKQNLKLRPLRKLGLRSHTVDSVTTNENQSTITSALGLDFSVLPVLKKSTSHS